MLFTLKNGYDIASNIVLLALGIRTVLVLQSIKLLCSFTH